MQKKFFLLCMMFAGWQMHAQTYFQNELTITSAGHLHEQVADIDYNTDDDVYRSVHKTMNGMGIFTYDGTANYMAVHEVYHTSGIAMYPVRIIDVANLTHILFFAQTPSGQTRYAVVQYDNGALIINWVKVLSNPSNNIDCLPKDMDIDPANGDIYVTGDQYNSSTADLDLFVTRIDAAGNQLWHYRYPVASRDELAFSVSFYDTSSIYLGAVSYGLGLDIKALVVQIDDNGSIVNQTDIAYGSTNNCQYNRMASACVKRQGNEIIVFIPSYAGSDGAGCFSLFKLDPSFSVLDFRMYDPGLVFYDPLFEFTDNGNNISVSGHQRIMATNPSLGYVTYNFSTSGFLNMGGFNYPNTVHSFWSPDLIRTVYNPATTDLVAVMDYSDYPDRFHLIKSNSFGATFTDCDKPLDHHLCDCEYDMRDPGIGQLGILTDFNDVNNVFIMSLEHFEAKICESEDCPDCGKRPLNLPGEQDEAARDIRVLPNPSAGDLTITSDYEMTGITIRDLSGRIVQTLNGINTTVLQVSLENEDKGVYFIEIATTGSEQLLYKKVVIQ